MKKVIMCLILCCGISLAGAQSFDVRKLEIGGNFGLQFGSYTLVNVAPQIGYRFSPYLTAGAGVSYSYYKDDYYSGSRKYDYSSNYFGMNVFGRFYPIKYLVFSVQPEANRMWRSVDGPGGKTNMTKFVPSVLVGGGVRFGPITAMIKYDLVQDDYSPYSDNIFYSIGYTFSF